MYKEKYLGICKDCNNKIGYFEEKTVFCGNENIEYLLAAVKYEGVVKEAIHRFKFSGQKRYAVIFSQMILKYLNEFDIRNHVDIITAIPVSRKRLFMRGYNQAGMIAKPLSEELGIDYSDNCIFKIKENKKQSRTGGRLERYNNVKNAYAADRMKVEGKRIMLVDDIYTSGATMNACAKELLNKGAKCVCGLTLAKTVFEKVY